MLAVLHLGYAMGQLLDQGIYVNTSNFQKRFSTYVALLLFFLHVGQLKL